MSVPFPGRKTRRISAAEITMLVLAISSGMVFIAAAIYLMMFS